MDLFRGLTVLLASGDVSLITWYRIHDLPNTQEVIGDVNNRFLGVLDEHGHPKPALRALVYFHDLFRGGFRCTDREVSGCRLLRSPAEAHAFELADGSLVLVAWLRTVVLGERGWTQAGEAADIRLEQITLSFPETHASAAEVFDALGRSNGKLPLERGGRGTQTVHLRLRGGGVAVLVIRPGRPRN